MPEVKPSEIQTFASIKVVGVGGAGGAVGPGHDGAAVRRCRSVHRDADEPGDEDR